MPSTIEEYALIGDTHTADRWRTLRAKIHETVCRDGYDPGRGSFVRQFGSTALDASLLLIPIVGFLPPHEPRVQGTIQAIERELMVDDGLCIATGPPNHRRRASSSPVASGWRMPTS